MNDDQKFAKAKAMINTFVEQLLALNNGKDIPPTWKNYFTRTSRPLPKKSGRKLNTKEHADMVNRIIDDLDRLNEEQTFGHTAEYKDKIAKEFGVSRKTVDRKLDAVNKTLRGETLDPGRREATNKGISNHLNGLLEAATKEENEIRKIRVEQYNKKNRISPPK